MIAADLANVQVWVATTPVDMRKSCGLAEEDGRKTLYKLSVRIA